MQPSAQNKAANFCSVTLPACIRNEGPPCALDPQLLFLPSSGSPTEAQPLAGEPGAPGGREPAIKGGSHGQLCFQPGRSVCVATEALGGNTLCARSCCRKPSAGVCAGRLSAPASQAACAGAVGSSSWTRDLHGFHSSCPRDPNFWGLTCQFPTPQKLSPTRSSPAVRFNRSCTLLRQEQ